jgi:hypothetical protein
LMGGVIIANIKRRGCNRPLPTLNFGCKTQCFS